ncbi:MAG: hypothetical protein P1T08_16910 [Acidimicrobiia bacterium]|nr:hypothetical protein [Acidimicrobiia bacterium]
MRRTLVVVVCWSLMLAACGTSAEDSVVSTTAPTAVTTTTTRVTVPPPTSTTAPAITSTSTTTTSIPPEAAAGPNYIVTGREGVFRVIAGAATLVLNQPDVMWAADDGMGGIVFYARPGVVEHLRADTGTSAVIAEDASPNYMALVGGQPAVEISHMTFDDCDDADSWHAMLIDLPTGEERMLIPCIPLESTGVHPLSIGGNLTVSVAGGGWPDEAPVSHRLILRSLDMPESITFVTEWDLDAERLLEGLAVDLSSNPWPEPTPWCVLTPVLSPDGLALALSEFVPQPDDLDAADWAEFNALDITEQWSRWEAALRLGNIRVRIIDLDTGEILFSTTRPGWGQVVDFDGRYVVYETSQMDDGGEYSRSVELIDSHTGDEIPINWAGNEPASSTIRLFLPTAPHGEVSLRGDGLGIVGFGDPYDRVLATLEQILGPPTEIIEGPDAIQASDDSFHYGGPDMTEVLAVWRPIGLFVAFSPYPFYRDDGVMHFSGWASIPSWSSVIGPSTPEGIGVGSTYAEANEAFGDRFVASDDECGPSAYVTPLGEDDVAFRIGLVLEVRST